MTKICEWFTECVDTRQDIITFKFSDGTEKIVKRGKYLLDVENNVRKMLEYKILNELSEKYEKEIKALRSKNINKLKEISRQLKSRKVKDLVKS